MRQAFFQDLSAAVAQMEDRSAVELVVVAASSSGDYADTQHLLAFTGALLCLLYLIHSPTEFDVDWFGLWVTLAYLATLVVVRRWPFLYFPLISRQRRLASALLRARAAFVEERVGSTRDRTGLLLFLCGQERLALFVTDLGIDACIPRATFNDIQARLAGCRSLEQFQSELLQQLQNLVEPLAEHLPARADDTNELSNEVRLRP